MTETVPRTRGRRGWMWAAGAAAAALVVGGATAVVLLDRSVACGCANPDAGLDVEYGTLGPEGAAVDARLEVVEVAAVDGYTRTVLEFSRHGDTAEEFDPAYFTGGAEPGDGFRVLDPASGRLYENLSGAGTTGGRPQVWEPRTDHYIVLFSAPLEPGTEEVELRGPHGEFRIKDIEVRNASGDTGPLWTPETAQEPPEDGEAPEAVVLPFTEPEPGATEPGHTEVFAPPAPEPVDPPAAVDATYDEWGGTYATEEHTGDEWRISVRFRPTEGDGDALVLDYDVKRDGDTEGDGAPPTGEHPDFFPDGLTLFDPDTGAVLPELRVGDPDGASEPLWSFARPRLVSLEDRTWGDLAFAAPEGSPDTLLLDAGLFGVLEVELPE